MLLEFTVAAAGIRAGHRAHGGHPGRTRSAVREGAVCGGFRLQHPAVQPSGRPPARAARCAPPAARGRAAPQESGGCAGLAGARGRYAHAADQRPQQRRQNRDAQDHRPAGADGAGGAAGAGRRGRVPVLRRRAGRYRRPAIDSGKSQHVFGAHDARPDDSGGGDARLARAARRTRARHRSGRGRRAGCRDSGQLSDPGGLHARLHAPARAQDLRRQYRRRA